MAIYLGGVEYANLYVAGSDAAGLFVVGEAGLSSDLVYSFTRSLDRAWGNTPGSGGGNVSPQTFTHDGDTWQLWQVVPYLGTSVGPLTVGDCRIQLRDTSKNRGQNLLASMPDEIVLTMASWTGSPWRFTRPTANNKFTNVSSGNSARKSIDYEPVRSIGASAAAEGIAEGQSFTIDLIFKS